MIGEFWQHGHGANSLCLWDIREKALCLCHRCYTCVPILWMSGKCQCSLVLLAKSAVTAFCTWLQGRHMEIMKALRRYVADEYRDKLKQTVDTSKWKIRWVPSQNPGREITTAHCGIQYYAVCVPRECLQQAHVCSITSFQ